MNSFADLAALSGLSDNGLAQCLGVSKSAVRSWRVGRRDPPPEIIDELSDLVAECVAVTREADARPSTVRVFDLNEYNGFERTVRVQVRRVRT